MCVVFFFLPKDQCALQLLRSITRCAPHRIFILFCVKIYHGIVIEDMILQLFIKERKYKYPSVRYYSLIYGHGYATTRLSTPNIGRKIRVSFGQIHFPRKCHL